MHFIGTESAWWTQNVILPTRRLLLGCCLPPASAKGAGAHLLVVARDDVRNHGVKVGALAGGGLRVDSQHVPAAGRPQEAAVNPVTPFLRVSTPQTSAGDMVAAAPRDGKPPGHVPAANGPQNCSRPPGTHFCGMEEAGKGPGLGGYEGRHASCASYPWTTESSHPPIAATSGNGKEKQCILQRGDTTVHCRAGPPRWVLVVAVRAASGATFLRGQSRDAGPPRQRTHRQQVSGTVTSQEMSKVYQRRKRHLVLQVVRGLVVEVPQVFARRRRLGRVELPGVHLRAIRPPDAEEGVVRRLRRRLQEGTRNQS